VALLVLKIAGAIVLLDLLVQAGFARAIIAHFERKPKLRARAYPPQRDAERFSTACPDGPLLRGSIVRAAGTSTDGVIVFCHEYGGSRWSYQGHCADHVTDRHDLVTFDFRNHGESDHDPGYTPCHWLTRCEVRDVEAVLGWVAAQPEWRGLPVTLVGVSRGANAALAAASGSNVDGVVAVGAFSTHDLAMHHLMAGIRRSVPAILAVPLWHIRSTLRMAIAWSGLRQRVRFVQLENSARQLDGCPVLLLAGGDDTHVPESFQRLLADRIPQATFWTVPGGRHNLERDAAPEEFDRRVSDFLNLMTGPLHRRSELPAIAECQLRRAA